MSSARGPADSRQRDLYGVRSGFVLFLSGGEGADWTNACVTRAEIIAGATARLGIAEPGKKLCVDAAIGERTLPACRFRHPCRKERRVGWKPPDARRMR